MCRRIQNCHNACQNKVMSDVPKFLFAQLLETKTKNNLSLKENLRACASSKTSFLPGVMWQQLLGKLYHHTSIPSSSHHTSLPSYHRPSFHNISTSSYHNHPTIPAYHHTIIIPSYQNVIWFLGSWHCFMFSGIFLTLSLTLQHCHNSLPLHGQSITALTYIDFNF